MRGTGSHDVLMQNVFVPDRRTAILAPLERPGTAYQGPLYKLTVWTVVSALSTVALGIARAAIDDLPDNGGKKDAGVYAQDPAGSRHSTGAVGRGGGHFGRRTRLSIRGG